MSHGFATFGVSRHPEDQPAIDRMAADYFNKIELDRLHVRLGQSISSLKFDSDEADRFRSVVGPAEMTVLSADRSSHFTAAARFYEYALNFDYAMKWMRALAGDIAGLSRAGSRYTVKELVAQIGRPDWAAWNVDRSGFLKNLDPGSRPGTLKDDLSGLASSPLRREIVGLSVGEARRTLTKGPMTVASAAPIFGTGVFASGKSMSWYSGGDEETKRLSRAAEVSGLRDYLGSKYLALMQLCWNALSSSGIVFGSTPGTWAQSIDHGPLLGRRFTSCGPGFMPMFYKRRDKPSDPLVPLPLRDALYWVGEGANKKAYINTAMVDPSMGGCQPAIGASWGSKGRMDASVFPGLFDTTGRSQVRPHPRLDFDARAMLIKPTTMNAGHKRRRRKSSSVSRRKHPAKRHRRV